MSANTPLITFAQFGLGPIGIEAVKLAAEKPWLRAVGAVDIDPAKVGKTLADLTGNPALAHAKVYPSAEALWAEVQPDVVLHTAGSKAGATFEQSRFFLERGVSVASTCEELVFPQLLAPEATAEFDALCKKHNARIVGTGVNPGFVMDLLPVFLTGVCREVSAIHGRRVVDATTRRQPLQAKIGSGQDPEAFRAKFREGKAGHAGFKQSVALVGHAMGWKLDRIEETCEPVIAEHRIQTKFFDVAAGLTRGLHQIARGYEGDRLRIELDLTMALEEKDPHDSVRIDGKPGINAVLQGGVAGDVATISALINAIPRLLAAPAGVRLLTDLPVPSVT